MEKGKSFVKVEYKGNIFKSLTEAARYAGVTRQAIYVAMKRGTKVKGHPVKRLE